MSRLSGLRRLSQETGSKILTYSASTIAIGSMAGQLGLHTFLLDQYSGLFQLYRNGYEVEVSDELESMLSQVSDDLAIPIKNPPTSLFGVIGFDIFHFGSTTLTTGARIGVPASFFYKSKADLDRSAVQIVSKPVPWSSADGEKLEKSLIMNDLAKKFAIGYELAIADTHKIFLQSVSAPFSVFLFSVLNNYFCDQFGLIHRPPVLKGIFYSLLTVFTFGVYCAMKDMATQYCELSALEKVCEGGEDYILGGLEFYEKLLSKNEALRNLLPDGHSDFTTKGDPIYWFRKKHVPPTEIKSILLQKFYKQQQQQVSSL